VGQLSRGLPCLPESHVPSHPPDYAPKSFKHRQAVYPLAIFFGSKSNKKQKREKVREKSPLKAVLMQYFNIVICHIISVFSFGNNRFIKTPDNVLRGRVKMPTFQKEVQTKLAKGLLDLIVLELLDSKPMHGYQIITKIRKNFGVYFGPSTVYPLLASLKEKGHVESRWNTETARPRKVYELTTQGKNILDFTENSLNLICHKISKDSAVEISAME
jgi:PadR family transcriptional regulator PadR